MNKVLAEIIAGVIPHKMTRNRWRGILRYGLCKALRLKHDLKHNNKVAEHYLALCAIAKNEGPYFKEWIIINIVKIADINSGIIADKAEFIRESEERYKKEIENEQRY